MYKIKINRQAKWSWPQIKKKYFFLFLRRRQKFLYELNTSGKYFAFKEQLKVSHITIYMNWWVYLLENVIWLEFGWWLPSNGLGYLEILGKTKLTVSLGTKCTMFSFDIPTGSVCLYFLFRTPLSFISWYSYLNICKDLLLGKINTN